MNPAFIILATIVIVALWFCCSFLFRPTGKFVYRIYKDTKDIINEEESEETSSEK